MLCMFSSNHLDLPVNENYIFKQYIDNAVKRINKLTHGFDLQRNNKVDLRM